ncbi:hypothetical protein LTR53_014078 [Teratosphaeriaceae sp. CCFEE 6253]|nr:hypothetical protein LTR53_014078 [Teratosphaeriaceae sp. CCFEE 6253]
METPECERCRKRRLPCPGYLFAEGALHVLIYTSPEAHGSAGLSPHEHAWASSASHVHLGPSSAQYGMSRLRARIDLVAVAVAMFIPEGEKPTIPLELMSVAGFDLSTLRCPRLLKAIETFSLAQLAALHLVRNGVDGVLADWKWDERLVSAILILAMCDVFPSLHAPNSMQMHASGLAELLRRCGPRPLRSHWQAMLFHQMRVVLLSNGLAARKTCFLDQPAWMAVSRGAMEFDPQFRLHDIAIRLPGLMEETDQALIDGSEATRGALAGKLATLIEELDDFSSHLPTLPPEAAGADDVEDSVDDWVDYQSSPGSGHRRHATWWGANLAGLSSLYRLHARTNALKLLQPADPAADFPHKAVLSETGLDDSIATLCGVIRAHAGPGNGYIGRMSTVPLLRCAVAYFQRRQMVEQVAWCGRTMNGVEGICGMELGLGRGDCWISGSAGVNIATYM